MRASGFSRVKSRARNILKKLFLRYKGYRLRELPTIDVAITNAASEPRVNLVLLGARKDLAFGGVDTALRFFDAIRQHYKRSRIIVLTEDNRDHDHLRWPGRELETQSANSPHTVAYLKQDDLRLLVENESDHFVATHWITAYYIASLREFQAASGRAPASPFVYLIQDFEPGFYPWSSRYLLASATYTKPNDTIAVFNTQLLKDYFEGQGYPFPASYVFEPKLNPSLAAFKSRLPQHKKRRLILVYGRPGVSRNAFELVTETLFAFAETYKNAGAWEILSLGESHRNIGLPNGLAIKTEGKVTLDRYAEHLLDASVGLSLMVSPHPSYPPLEMAEFGVRVVTNRFANKDLSERTSNIVSISDARPATLAKALADACDAFEAGAIERDVRPAFLGTDDEFPFRKDLAERMSVTTGSPAT
jgi:O-antigen biosynthesis protein